MKKYYSKENDLQVKKLIQHKIRRENYGETIYLLPRSDMQAKMSSQVFLLWVIRTLADAVEIKILGSLFQHPGGNGWKAYPKSSKEKRRCNEHQSFKGGRGGGKYLGMASISEDGSDIISVRICSEGSRVENAMGMQHSSQKHRREQRSIKCMSQVKFRTRLGNFPQIRN